MRQAISMWKKTPTAHVLTCDSRTSCKGATLRFDPKFTDMNALESTARCKGWAKIDDKMLCTKCKIAYARAKAHQEA